MRLIDTLNGDFFVIFRGKVAKAPGRDKISRLSLLLASCFATSLGRHKLATSNLSAVCRVLRIALRTAILRKDNCRTAFERTSHNGLQTAGISVVILTLPVSLEITFVCVEVRNACQ